LLEAVLLDCWHQEVRIVRWRFLASTAVRRHRRRARGLVTQAIVERYRIGENIVRLDSRLPANAADPPDASWAR
jgi:hypothetical protein